MISYLELILCSCCDSYAVFEFYSFLSVCLSVLNQAAVLEKEAHPALDKLTSKISTLNLEHVRQIKSRLVAITGRVQKVSSPFSDECNNALNFRLL